MKPNAEDLAYDRWPEILTAHGMADEFFRGRNGPCPFCGGKDRFRWSKRHGGVWVCNQCTGGKYASGFQMLMQHLGLSSFVQAADAVREHFGVNGADAQALYVPRPVVRSDGGGYSDEEKARNLRKMQAIWNQSLALSKDDPVMLYLRHRVPGLDFVPQEIRFHPALEYWSPPEQEGERPILLGKFPAMVAKALDADGQLVQIHKTYLTREGRKADVPIVKKTERGVGCNSFAIRMQAVTADTLGVGEGIESALAAAMLRDVPVWPCLNGPAMSQFVLPHELRGQVTKLLIFADHDELKPTRCVDGHQKFARPGSVYAEKLAIRARRAGLSVMIIKAAKVGHDMADHWSRNRTTTTDASALV